MGNCVVYPIPLFRTEGDMSRITYRLNIGRPLTLVNYVWYIAGAKEKVLVDAGGSSEFLLQFRGIAAQDIQSLDHGLSKLGISADEIDLVILTHLHHDHVAQAFHFPKAKMLVQKDELEFARNPHPFAAGLYHREFIDGLNFEIVNGDVEISEDISVMRTAGHTPGGQSVKIRTSLGTVIISGLCTCQENFAPPPPVDKTTPIVIPTVHTDPFKAYDSMIRIKQVADIVVPIHDAKFQQGGSIP